MKPDAYAKNLLGVTRSKAKMFEYNVPLDYHISIEKDPSSLFDLTIGILGDYCVESSSNTLELPPILFSAQFFDAFYNANFRQKEADYLRLLAASAYYLGGFPGSAKVLAEGITNPPKLDAGGLEYILFAILNSSFRVAGEYPFSPRYSHIAIRLLAFLDHFFSSGEGSENISQEITNLRNLSYESVDRELLFGDILSAVIKAKTDRSVWKTLPRYSGVSVEKWAPILGKDNALRELWPSQQILCERNILLGESAVIQMPTSAGKTRSTELIIRSSFFSDRANLALIVAPFRALCNEIHNSMSIQFKGENVNIDIVSDVLQSDMDMDSILGVKAILILTPEKLDYLLRHDPELPERIGLIIFDEGHLLDDNSRGISYELLLVSLRLRLPANAQVLFMSAVIGNASEISEWLLGSSERHVDGAHLSPTYRTIAFVSWSEVLGRLYFLNEEDHATFSFFVPRVLQQHNVLRLPRERKDRVFPEKTNTAQIAIYLGCNVIHNGSVAVFIGRKDSAKTVANAALDAFNREAKLPNPADFANSRELNLLISLCEKNLGDCTITNAARLGILIHHGSIPHGLRLAFEKALQIGDARFVICTSTLAQGVNLPIRYLIITNDRQGRTRIKTRDFQNLMGRAGRSGQHTEGTIIFANPSVYDSRAIPFENWRWRDALSLLDPSQSEPCRSRLLSALESLKLKNGSELPLPADRLWLLKVIYEHPLALEALATRLAARYGQEEETDEESEYILSQLIQIQSVLHSAESGLLRYLVDEEVTTENLEENIRRISEGTLAYQQAKETEKNLIIAIFNYLAQQIYRFSTDLSQLRKFAKSVLSLTDSLKLRGHFTESITRLLAAENNEDLLAIFLPFIVEFSTNSFIKAVAVHPNISKVAALWIQGAPFYEMIDQILGLKIGRSIVTIENVVDICEKGFGFEGALVVSSCIEMVDDIGFEEEEIQSIKKKLLTFQKCLKYGLPSKTSVAVYEIGFQDRSLAIEISELLALRRFDRDTILLALSEMREAVEMILSNYPRYFRELLSNIF